MHFYHLRTFAISKIISNINYSCFVSHICDTGHTTKEENEAVLNALHVMNIGERKNYV